VAKGIEVIARGLLFNGSRVLLCRNVEAGYFYLPGGHVEFGEAAAGAVEREFEEECGLKVKSGPCVLVTEGSFEARGKRHHEVNVVFHVERIGDVGEDVTSHEDGLAFEWVDVASLTDVDLRPQSIRAWLASGGAVEPPDSRVGWASEIRVG
jgi:8-oxo-dGTP diphosphatase